MDDDLVVGFFRHGTEILLVRRECSRSDRWDTVSVPADGATGKNAAERLDAAVGDAADATLVRRADPIVVEGDGIRRTLHPYLFECSNREVELADSIAAREWVQPPAMLDRKTALGLWDAYLAISPSARTVREDTEHGAAFVSLRALEALRDRAAVAAAAGEGYDSVASLAKELRRARPGMGVVAVRIDRVMASAERTPVSVRDRASAACEDAVRADRAAAERAASRLGDRVLTLSRSGTVRSALEIAAPDSVYVAESRPAREGIGVAERLADGGADVTVLVDAAIEGLLASGAVDTVLVGADTVLADGSVVNKVGTRTALRAARDAEIDGYAVCSRDKVVPETEFDPDPGPPEAIYDGDFELDVYSPTFERTPASAPSGIITEDGVYSPDEVASIARTHASYREWIDDDVDP